MTTDIELRPLGHTDMHVSTVSLGCWPISGMPSLGVNDADSLATIRTCFDVGVNHLDTAYGYGADGESERLIARALGNRRDEMVIATKVGIHWGADGQEIWDARPERLRQECEESLRRLETDRVELLYLHGPDPKLPVSESAGGLKELMDEGKARAIGVSNFSEQQLEEFHAVCPITAFQPPYNMLLRDIERDTLPWCRQHGVSVLVYFPLMKGLLAGKLPRDHVFEAGDDRATSPMFQGDEWNKNQDFVDRLSEIASEAGKTVAQLSVNWAIRQAGVTSALCGAKRATQIKETAASMNWELTPEQLAQIDAAVEERGAVVMRNPD